MNEGPLPGQGVPSHGGSSVSLDIGSGDRVGRTWLLTGSLLILLGFILGFFVRGDRVLPGELSLLQWMHEGPNEGMDLVAWWASRLGDAYTGLMAFTIAATLWCVWRGRPDLALFLVIVSASRVLGPPLKWFFASARPPLDLQAVIEPADGLGYPSGHTLGAVLVYGAALLAVPLTLSSPVARWAVRAACLALLVVIPWSRMRLGVHWPSDIAGGYLFGAGFAAVSWSLMPWLRERLPVGRGLVGKPH